MIKKSTFSFIENQDKNTLFASFGQTSSNKKPI